MNAPLISIGVTCFNAEDTIERAITSALGQEWANTEIIVVDDASSDGSVSVLEALVARHPEVRIIRHPVNRGYPGALNSIVESAKGGFIAIFDDDDVSDPGRLRAQVERIVDYENMTGAERVFCYSNRHVVQAGAEEPDHVAEALGRRPVEPSGIAVAEHIFGYRSHPEYVWGLFGSCTLMARRETFQEIGPFDEKFRRCAEWDYAIRGAFMGSHFIAVDKPLITQYKTKTGDKSGKTPLKYDLMIREKYKPYLTAKRFYWASRCISHARFVGSKGGWLKSNLFMLAACLISPPLLKGKLVDRALHRFSKD